MTNRLLALAAATALVTVPVYAVAQATSAGAHANHGAATSAAAPATSATPAEPAMNATPSTGGAMDSTSSVSGAAAVTAGLSVKDKTGAVIGSVTEVKADASGGQLATIKMGEQTFTVSAASLAVQDGAAVINASQGEIQQMIKGAKS